MSEPRDHSSEVFAPRRRRARRAPAPGKVLLWAVAMFWLLASVVSLAVVFGWLG